MPKKIIPDEEYEEEEDDYDEEDEEEEEAPVVRSPGRPKKVVKHNPGVKQPPAPAQKRYSAFQQQAAEGIVDSETQEIVAGDIWTALANIMERLERIENAIGVMQ